MLEVRDLVKIYARGLLQRKPTVALDGISFCVAPQEMIALVGESGSGKTTTAHIILRLTPPTSGQVLFQGKDIQGFHGSELKKYWREVHGVFQDPYAAFNPMYKADRIIYQCFKLLSDRFSDKKKVVEEALAKVGLRPKDVLGKYPHQLSGGQMQRLMIARCFVLRPKLIVADEPISMVDASVRVGILKLFEELRQSFGTAVIFITHDIGLAYYMCSRMLVMYKGKIVEEGTPEEILDHPKHPYTQRLIGDIPLLRERWSDI
jgi:peptide/nickel transport system ATP-binding protein